LLLGMTKRKMCWARWVAYVPNYYWKSTLLWVVDQTIVINYFICNKSS
jgi:hypothetical protein